MVKDAWVKQININNSYMELMKNKEALNKKSI